MVKELNSMRLTFTGSTTSISLRGKAVPGAEDRQRQIPGFDQEKFSRSHVLCMGAGGIISQIAPTLIRKGIGRITLLDDDMVEVSNLNRQRFYIKDIGKNKAIALARNLQPECIVATNIQAHALRLEEAIARRIDLGCDVAICGVDNNPARIEASRFFRAMRIPVIFTAVSRDADHGYVFAQDKRGACIACMFPDMVNDDRYPCPGTPAIADILQAVGALAVYAADAILLDRPRTWNYRRLSLSDPSVDGCSMIVARAACELCSHGTGLSDHRLPNVCQNPRNLSHKVDR
jgi:molybdopterin/thiamine biosynthesis adenylyltransferase